MSTITVQSVIEDMEASLATTLRRGAHHFPPNQRKTRLDWVAMRCEVEAWVAKLREVENGKCRLP